MGCRHDIADRIAREKGDYVFSLKGNQGTLHKDVKEYFDGVDFNKPKPADRNVIFDSTSTHDEGHGRKEYRDYAVSDDVEWLTGLHPAWDTIKTIGMVEAVREVKGKEPAKERRYFVSSLPKDVNVFATAVRSHWGIENSPQYILDTAFKEDACRIKKENGPENMAVIRKTALTLINSGTESKSSVAGKLKQAAWSDEYLLKLLFSSSHTWNCA